MLEDKFEDILIKKNKFVYILSPCVTLLEFFASLVIIPDF